MGRVKDEAPPAEGPAREGGKGGPWLRQCSRMLLDADVAVKNNHGSTALHDSALAGHETAARMLLDAAAKDKGRWTQGSRRMSMELRQCARMLLDAGGAAGGGC